MPFRIVVMGVSGCGKSTLTREIAARLGGTAIEGDDYHLPQSQDKMRQGIALADADREPWLDRIGAELASSSGNIVISCSSLKRQYRDRLRKHAPDLRFVYVDIDQAEAERRVASRPGHLFPASLVASQFAALEPPLGEAGVLRVRATDPPEVQVRAVTDWLAAVA